MKCGDRIMDDIESVAAARQRLEQALDDPTAEHVVPVNKADVRTILSALTHEREVYDACAADSIAIAKQRDVLRQELAEARAALADCPGKYHG